MSKPKHTPGPWGVAARQGDDWDSVVYQQSNPNLEVCQCFHANLSLEGKERCEATTRLIAAAPEMYEALEFLSHLSAESFSPWAKGLKMARAAIAKAKNLRSEPAGKETK